MLVILCLPFKSVEVMIYYTASKIKIVYYSTNSLIKGTKILRIISCTLKKKLQASLHS